MKKLTMMMLSLMLSVCMVACSEETQEETTVVFEYVVKVVEVSNEAVIERNEESINAYEGMNLQSGDLVSVQEDAYLCLLLDSNKYVYVGENSLFSIESDGDEDSSQTYIELQYGTILNSVDETLGEDSSYEVSTPNATLGVRGTIFGVEVYIEDDITYTDVYELEGYIYSQLYVDDVLEDIGMYIASGYKTSISSNTTSIDDIEKEVLDITTINDAMFTLIYELSKDGNTNMYFSSYDIEIEAQSRGYEREEYLLFVTTDVSYDYYYYNAGETIDLDSFDFDDYNVLGWYDNWNLDNEMNLTVMPEEDTKIYALLEKGWEGYKLIIHYEDGVELVTYLEEGELFSTTMSLRSEVSVEGFYTSSDLIIPFLDEATMPAIDYYEIYAKLE